MLAMKPRTGTKLINTIHPRRSRSCQRRTCAATETQHASSMIGMKRKLASRGQIPAASATIESRRRASAPPPTADRNVSQNLFRPMRPSNDR